MQTSVALLLQLACASVNITFAVVNHSEGKFALFGVSVFGALVSLAAAALAAKRL